MNPKKAYVIESIFATSVFLCLWQCTYKNSVSFQIISVKICTTIIPGYDLRNCVKVASTFLEETLYGLPTKAEESTKLENRVMLAIKFFERFFVETVFG